MSSPQPDSSTYTVTLPRLKAEATTLAYDGRVVARDLTVSIPTGKLSVILGPNACGKTTLLRALARLIAPNEGQVVLDGKDIRRYPTK
ncbi:MAG: ABC transporter ATP-binding protein, partial [Trueperaceae bacterium]|nr:ABC transporter ATP-binding protein [Trueperaceae bacterium]